MDKQKDELDEIFVDKNEPADKKLIVDILKPYVTIDNEGIINFKEEYEKLTESKKALVYFICKKAMILRGVVGINESIGQTELSKGAQISESSARHAIFRDFKKILKKEGSGYVILNYKLKKIMEILSKNETNTSK